VIPKNILIFSDGTGQAGGISVDENRTNIYKLYRATRVSPDTCIEPSEQVAFYDAGLGSAPINGGFFTTVWRYVHNFVSQATGYGLTANIIDCYEMIVRLWRPGDRIYLFGFSRGAYTVRCVAGVLRLCGVPTYIGTEPLTYAPATTRAIAKEAVKKVYQHTASWVIGQASPRQLELLKQRDELAIQFRKRYRSSDPKGDSNGYPYFIGVFDTVAAIANPGSLLLLSFGVIALVFLVSAVLWYFPLFSVVLLIFRLDPASYSSWLLLVAR
jgi:uncharacterized protein (DUF2235 family)